MGRDASRTHSGRDGSGARFRGGWPSSKRAPNFSLTGRIKEAGEEGYHVSMQRRIPDREPLRPHFAEFASRVEIPGRLRTWRAADGYDDGVSVSPKRASDADVEAEEGRCSHAKQDSGERRGQRDK